MKKLTLISFIFLVISGQALSGTGDGGTGGSARPIGPEKAPMTKIKK